MWNETKVRKTPLLSHLSHWTPPFSKHQLSKHSALARICSLQLPETNHSIQLQDTEDIFLLCMRGLKAGLVAKFLPAVLLFLRSTPRAGLRQNSRKASCVAHPTRTPAGRSLYSQLQGCSIPPGHLHVQHPLVWERWGNIAIPVPRLAWLSVPWADRVIKPQRMSLQAPENQYQQLPVTNEHLPKSQNVMFDSLWEQRD